MSSDREDYSYWNVGRGNKVTMVLCIYSMKSEIDRAFFDSSIDPFIFDAKDVFVSTKRTVQ